MLLVVGTVLNKYGKDYSHRGTVSFVVKSNLSKERCMRG